MSGLKILYNQLSADNEILANRADNTTLIQELAVWIFKDGLRSANKIREVAAAPG